MRARDALVVELEIGRGHDVRSEPAFCRCAAMGGIKLVDIGDQLCQRGFIAELGE